MDGSLAEAGCPWYYPIPWLVSRPRVSSQEFASIRTNGRTAKELCSDIISVATSSGSLSTNFPLRKRAGPLSRQLFYGK